MASREANRNRCHERRGHSVRHDKPAKFHRTTLSKTSVHFSTSDLEAVRNLWPHRLIVKGVDALVSNHGGRQRDGSAATLDRLPEVVAAVKGRIPVLMDGGVRRSGDVIKAHNCVRDPTLACMVGRRTVVLLALSLAACVVACAVKASCTSAHTVNSALKPLVDAAVGDLARRLRIPAAEVCVVDARSVLWPDGSLGCPRPGMLYPQALQDGVFIRLQAQGRAHAYHGGSSRAPFLCDSPERRDPPATTNGTGAVTR